MSVLPIATVLAIALAVLLGEIRLWLNYRRAAEQGPRWRLIAQAMLQVAAGAALAATVFPPDGPAGVGVRNGLVIATSGAPNAIPLATGERLVVLPEAPSGLRGERAPDLATAIRRHPAVRSLRIVGHGLSARDRVLPPGLQLTFSPARLPPRILRITPPAIVAPGQVFKVAGAVGPLPGAMVELADPAGRVIDQAPAAANGRFLLIGAARAPGVAVFEVRLRDERGKVVERLDVPVDATPRPRPRVVVLAGAPSPEIKFLRRWAEQAGIAVSVEIDLGAGVRLGDPATPLTTASLAGIDLVVIEDRRWESIGPEGRKALLAAVSDGMGLLWRLTGPPHSSLRQSWSSFGLSVVGGDAPQNAPTRRAVDGPEPTSFLPAPTGPNAITAIDGAASWTALGQGRLGILTLADSYVLQQSGRGDRHGQIWGELFATLARPSSGPSARIDGFARAGSRLNLCGLVMPPTPNGGPAPVVTEPAGAKTALIVDPAAGPGRCAAYWPATPGWRSLRNGAEQSAFYIHPAGAAPGLAAAEARDATLALASKGLAEGLSRARSPGSSWPWFGLLLAMLAALWRLERLNSWQSAPSSGADSDPHEPAQTGVPASQDLPRTS